MSRNDFLGSIKEKTSMSMVYSHPIVYHGLKLETWLLFNDLFLFVVVVVISRRKR